MSQRKKLLIEGDIEIKNANRVIEIAEMEIEIKILAPEEIATAGGTGNERGIAKEIEPGLIKLIKMQYKTITSL